MKKIILVLLFITLGASIIYANDDLDGLGELLNSLDSTGSVSNEENINDNQENTNNEVGLDGLPTSLDDTIPSENNSGNTTDNMPPVGLDGKNTNLNNVHAAADNVDNVVYNPFGYIKGDYVYVFYIPGKGVENVKILYSYDGINFTPLITLSADKKYYYFPVDFSKKEVYIKIIPILNGQEGIMKEGTKTIPFIEIPLSIKKIANKRIGRAKTGPELGILFMIAFIIYFAYRYRKS